ncbi:ABC transporter permease [Roseivirga echinicomitans]|uniref:ABC transporter permease n=1 Tax=Roseivirga echinicomitans TaxID=296218 RepID=A0A150XCU5_9BACT|nr:ABC transporter permease [Roseivirga echinicomitans]KYG76543.1 hypothetical protein AWN68_05795 [Roseivirga echinicomitans]
MSKLNPHIAPPAFASRLLRWFCHSDFHEELAGDLEENFLKNTEIYGLKKAKRKYTIEVLGLLRPSVIKKVRLFNYQNNTAMFKNYTLVAFRNLSRNRLFSAINILGLAMSMAVALLAIVFVTEIYSFDEFHKNKDRIYRVNNIVIKPDGELSVPYASTSLLAAQKIREQVPGIEKVASFFKGFYGDLKTENETYSIEGYFASKEFFEVFTFPMVQGNPETALTEPYSLVLTESTAIKMFNSTDVLGKTLLRRKTPYTITAVVKDPPRNSHLRFDVLGAQSTLASETRNSVLTDWNSMWSSYAYLLVSENRNLEQIQASIDQIAKEENAKSQSLNAKLRIERMSDIFPGEDRWNEVGTVMPNQRLSAMIILALIVIFSACFNYANLSIARSLKRAKEIGVRKVVGAKQGQIFTQFITESILVSLISLILAFFLFRLIRPEFLSLDFYISRTTTLELTTSTYFYFFLFTVLIGFLAGCIPALVMTNFKPISIMKGIANMKVSEGINIRKILIGIQFVLSMGFAILVTLTYKQYQFALNFDLGYETEAILNVELQGNDFDIVKSAFIQIPEIEGISGSAFMPSTGSTNSDHAKIESKADSVVVYSIRINEDYIQNLKHEILAGGPINDDLQKKQMIVNEAFLKQFELGSPIDAIGQIVDYYNENREIVGVIEDFHYGTIYNDIQPFAFIQSEGYLNYTNLKIRSKDMNSTMAKIANAWNSIDSNHDLQASFFDEDIERTYKDLSSSMKTYGLLSIVAISISILGLLGMAVYTAEARLKELTIRKVLGASVQSLVSLLSKNFVIIFIVSAAVAIPTSYYLFKNTIAQNMEYTINIGFWELGSGAILVITTALLTISSQAIKAAKANPSESLRSE